MAEINLCPTVKKACTKVTRLYNITMIYTNYVQLIILTLWTIELSRDQCVVWQMYYKY